MRHVQVLRAQIIIRMQHLHATLPQVQVQLLAQELSHRLRTESPGMNKSK